MKEAATDRSKAEGAIRGLERIKADFQMRGANATTIERAISTIRQAADHIETLEARVATLSAALAGIESAISKGIRENDLPHHTIHLPDGTVVSGPVADYFRNILVAIRDLAAREATR